MHRGNTAGCGSHTTISLADETSNSLDQLMDGPETRQVICGAVNYGSVGHCVIGHCGSVEGVLLPFFMVMMET